VGAAGGAILPPVTHAIIVQCPSCDAGYLLPRKLVGSLGARVTCPVCDRVFDVDVSGTPVAATAAPGADPAAGDSATWEPLRPFSPGTDATDDERAVAAGVLDELDARLGPDLERAVREGRLFRDHGPELIAAFDEYRHRAGEAAGPQAFREELLRRWRVDLLPLAEARR